MVSTLARPSIPLNADRALWLVAAATVAGFIALAQAQIGIGASHVMHFAVYMLATGQWSPEHAFGYILSALPLWVAYSGVVRSVLWTFVVYISWWGWEGVALAYSFMLSTGVGGLILGVLSGAVLG
ncbi:MAG TPA: hypothetical protein VET65_04560 [Candidatus Limnocylindrales bacterium]|nr:hypothetical protein [Candidatus Limnocylindrales bacterium]